MKSIFSLSVGYAQGEVWVEPLFEYNYLDLFLNKDSKGGQVKKFKVAKGKKLYDKLRFSTDVRNFLISKRFFDLLNQNNISGWNSYSVDVQGLDAKYHGFQVVGSTGAQIKPKEVSNNFVLGQKFDMTMYDGSDIFVPNGTSLILCSSNVVELCKKHKITNIQFKNIKNVRWYCL